MQQPTVPVSPPPAPSPPVDMAAFVSRQAELTSSLSRLRIEQRNLVREMQAAGGNPSASKQQELVQLDLAIANAQAELSVQRVQIESRMSSSLSSTAMPVSLDVVGGGVAPILFVALVIGVLLAILGAVVRRSWRRSRGVPSPADASDVFSARLDRVDQSLDAIAIEVERIAESQRFVAKTVAELAAARGK